MGLLLVRQGQTEAGVDNLKLAAELEPENGRFTYVYGVALYSTGNQREAIQFLEEARKQNPFDRDILYGLVSYYGEMGQLKEARAIAKELAGYYPEDQRYKDVLQRLNNMKVVK